LLLLSGPRWPAAREAKPRSRPARLRFGSGRGLGRLRYRHRCPECRTPVRCRAEAFGFRSWLSTALASIRSAPPVRAPNRPQMPPS